MRLSNHSHIIGNCRPNSTFVKNLCALGVEENFTRKGDFTWRVSDCEELVGVFTGDGEVGFMDIDYWSNHPF
jgi:hypothetical protein